MMDSCAHGAAYARIRSPMRLLPAGARPGRTAAMSPSQPQPYRDRRSDRGLLPPSASDCIAPARRNPNRKGIETGTVTSLMRHAVTKLGGAIRQGLSQAETSGSLTLREAGSHVKRRSSYWVWQSHAFGNPSDSNSSDPQSSTPSCKPTVSWMITCIGAVCRTTPVRLLLERHPACRRQMPGDAPNSRLNARLNAASES